MEKVSTGSQRLPENLMGFIVEVKPKGQCEISYQYDSVTKVLHQGETFLGYFWQMTDLQEDGSFRRAHIEETILLEDKAPRQFSYGGKAVFTVNNISISIRALRVPDSNNCNLSMELKDHETWYCAKLPGMKVYEDLRYIQHG